MSLGDASTPASTRPAATSGSTSSARATVRFGPKLLAREANDPSVRITLFGSGANQHLAAAAPGNERAGQALDAALRRVEKSDVIPHPWRARSDRPRHHLLEGRTRHEP